MKVLVAIDESEESFYALQWTVNELLGYSPAEEHAVSAVTLLHVYPPFQPFIYPAGPVYATPVVLHSVNKAQREKAASILSRALTICTEKNATAETLIMEGDAKDKICEMADELQVDLVVMGSRGHGAIKRALLGSVSSYCAHNLHCPVLIVKLPPGEGKPSSST